MVRTEIRAVRTRRDLNAFVDLGWDIYAGDPNWVPPLRFDLAALVTPGRHPFWDFSRRELFLAWQRDRPVGRIAAIIDGNHNQCHHERMGVWGFFECRHDLEAAAGLFKAAETWLADQGMTFVRGPLNPSLNYEAGLLIHGFESPPALMMTYNPPYYGELVAMCGYRKEKDLLAYRVGREIVIPAWADGVAGRIAERGEYTIVSFRRGRFSVHLRRLTRLYNEIWADNWGFVPMTDEEMQHTAKLLRHVMDRDLGFFVYHHDEPIGVGMLLPDIHPLLRRLNGRLGPRALFTWWRYRSEITGLRGLIFGVKEDYRQLGVPFFALDYLRRVLAGKPQYRSIELGWNLEDNQAINLLYDEGGLQAGKRYRLFRKELPAVARA